MIKCNLKYANLEQELTELEDVLKESLQKETLTIKEINKESEKYHHVNDNIRDISAAKYVIFSVYMCKDYHESEQFLFVDEKGKLVCTISGRETDLYDMIKNCENLVESPKF